MATNDFAQYLLHEKAKSVPVSKYETQTSLRIWLKVFEQQAKIHGIENINICCSYVAIYMPDLIKNWLSTADSSILLTWTSLKEALLHRFGFPAEDENRQLLKQLKNCKKLPTESIRIHASRWEHKLSLLVENYSEKSKIAFFLASIEERDTRLTLSSMVKALKLDTIKKVIDQAIELEDDAKLYEQPEVTQQYDYNSNVTPMEIDHFQKITIIHFMDIRNLLIILIIRINIINNVHLIKFVLMINLEIPSVIFAIISIGL